MKKLLLSCLAQLMTIMASAGHYYWTADGQRQPLMPEGNVCYRIPAVAVAVDFRNNTTTSFSVDVSQANPNCLYYMDEAGALPEGLDTTLNLIRGLEAQYVRVLDTHDYYCPLGFHADFVSFLMRPSYDDADDERRGRGYSATLVLPFHVDHANLYDVNGESSMLHADMLRLLSYEGHHADTLYWSYLNSIGQIEAYVPYMIGVYVGSRVLFMGEDIHVPQTMEVVVNGEKICFKGTTIWKELPAGTYQYDNSGNAFRYVPSETRIAPFRAYMDMRSKSIDNFEVDSEILFFSDDVWGTNGNPNDAAAISESRISETHYSTRSVNDISGRRVFDHPLPKGIYIVEGRKVVVR